MRPKDRSFSPACLGVFFGLTSHAATMTGVVKAPDNAGFRGAFVKAQDTQTKITVAVLSDDAGRYRIDNLPAGEYQISIRAVGYRADPGMAVTLTSNGRESFDVALQKDVVQWSDISLYQGRELFPYVNGRDLFFESCTKGCHAFQTKIATATHDAGEWKKRVEYERTTNGHALGHLTNQDVERISFYLSRLFGPDSELEKSPSDRRGEDMHAGYQDTVRSFGSDSLNIVYVEYDVPPPGRFPYGAARDKLGNIWIPNGGVANKITRLTPQQGALQDFSVSNPGTADIHSLVPAPDGSIWLAEQGTNRLGRWDPSTQKIVEYQDESGKEGGSKHTVRMDAVGNIWSSGIPLTKFDPKTTKFTGIEKVPVAYDVELDEQGNAWFTDPVTNRIGRVDGKTLNVSKWELPSSNASPRRIQIAPDGRIWVAEFKAGKLARLDPKTQNFSEYALPGPDPSPCAMAFDADGFLWYSSQNTDTIVRFDTKTGKTIQYPFPHSEIGTQEFFRDSAGKIWFASPANNKVGYFFLSNKTGKASPSS
jgi:virginiamycin B lyase